MDAFISLKDAARQLAGEGDVELWVATLAAQADQLHVVKSWTEHIDSLPGGVSYIRDPREWRIPLYAFRAWKRATQSTEVEIGQQKQPEQIPFFAVPAVPHGVDEALLALPPHTKVKIRTVSCADTGHGVTSVANAIADIQRTMERQAKGNFTMAEAADVLAAAHDLDAYQFLTTRMHPAARDGTLALSDPKDGGPLAGRAAMEFYDWVTPDSLDAWLERAGFPFRWPIKAIKPNTGAEPTKHHQSTACQQRRVFTKGPLAHELLHLINAEPQEEIVTLEYRDGSFIEMESGISIAKLQERLREDAERQRKGFFTIGEVDRLLADANSGLMPRYLAKRMVDAYVGDGNSHRRLARGDSELPLLETDRATYRSLVKADDVDEWLSTQGVSYRLAPILSDCTSELHPFTPTAAKQVTVAGDKPSETPELRQARRWQICIDAGLTMPQDTYSHLPRGIGAIANEMRITRQALTQDLNAYRERTFGR